MIRLFISYRRDDSQGLAGRIFDRLAARFGQDSIMIDVDSIPFGVDFRDHIAGMIARCDAVLAVIGPNWAGVARDSRRRIDDPTDLVRIEIATAMERGVRVIPILIGRTPMPADVDLPDALKPLAFINACVIDPGRDFHAHLDRLMRQLQPGADAAPDRPAVPGSAPAPPVEPNSTAVVEVVSGPGKGRRVELGKDSVTIGRAPNCDLHLDDPTLSRFHAQLVRTELGYAVEDLRTRNGTHVNGKRIATERIRLDPGDLIHVGAVILRYDIES